MPGTLSRGGTRRESLHVEIGRKSDGRTFIFVQHPSVSIWRAWCAGAAH
jgi:hypothetical protein